MWKRIACVVLPLLALAPCRRRPPSREARVPLHDGKLRTADLSAALCREMGLPECSFDCRRDRPPRARRVAVRRRGQRVARRRVPGQVSDDAVVLRIDTDKLPDDVRDAKRAARVFTRRRRARGDGEAARVLRAVDAARTSTRASRSSCSSTAWTATASNWQPMVDLLHQRGPAGRHVHLPQRPADRRQRQRPRRTSSPTCGCASPSLSYDLICHSMGGLVAREYVEGERLPRRRRAAHHARHAQPRLQAGPATAAPWRSRSTTTSGATSRLEPELDDHRRPRRGRRRPQAPLGLPRAAQRPRRGARA